MVRNQQIRVRTGPDMLECAYGLRYVADNGNLDGRERWSTRQYAVYQKHDPSCNQVVWVFVGIPKESSIEQHVMDHIRKYPFTDSMHSFALHLTLIEASIVAWRWYLNDMTERVQDQVRGFQVFLAREAYHE